MPTQGGQKCWVLNGILLPHPSARDPVVAPPPPTPADLTHPSLANYPSLRTPSHVLPVHAFHLPPHQFLHHVTRWQHASYIQATPPWLFRNSFLLVCWAGFSFLSLLQHFISQSHYECCVAHIPGSQGSSGNASRSHFRRVHSITPPNILNNLMCTLTCSPICCSTCRSVRGPTDATKWGSGWETAEE